MKRWSDDQKILTALEKLGGNASAQELSDYISKHEKDKDGKTKRIPARTIRYRLSTLIERGILLPSFLETDERKIGLGEGILVLQEAPRNTDLLERVIREIPIFHWYVPTNGKQDGYLVHTTYDITKPSMVDDISKKLKKHGLIQDSFFFDIANHHTKTIDFSLYRPSKGWACKWNEWKTGIESHLEKNMDPPIDIKTSNEVIEYDSKDILILRVLRDDPDATMTSLASITRLPIGTVRDRIQRLRKMSVIKGYSRAYGFAGDFLWFSCFLQPTGKVGSILQSIMELPFPGVVLVENPKSFCVRLGLSASDVKQFMDGFRLFRPHLKSYAFQFHLPDKVESKYREIFNLYDGQEERWNIPLESYLGVIEKHAK
ncbi:MAG: winged helix-turn-helix transcriptional regulator [Candidatus Thorarchaeota archaeon]